MLRLLFEDGLPWAATTVFLAATTVFLGFGAPVVLLRLVGLLQTQL